MISALKQGTSEVLPRIQLTSGTVEIAKWLAVILMTLDHFNKFLYNGTIPYFSELGRLALPLFAFIFAFNLARQDSFKKGVYLRAIKKLVVFGVISTVPYVALGAPINSWWPLNILFTLAAAASVIAVIEKNKPNLAVLVFLISGALVEYSWPAIILTVGAWLYCRNPSIVSLLIWFMGLLSLYFANSNWWALATIPIIVALPFIKVSFPRWPFVFYFYYPAHLGVLWLLKLNH